MKCLKAFGINAPGKIVLSITVILCTLVAIYSLPQEVADGLRWVLLLGSFVGICYVACITLHLASLDVKVLDLPLALSRDTPIFETFLKFSHELKRISEKPDPVFRTNAIRRLNTLHKDLVALGDGTLLFRNTESWRLVYEQLLRSKVVYLYRSVAWVRDGEYWQDEPGQKNLQLSFNLVANQQLSMERIIIISDVLWPANDVKPVGSVVKWIQAHRQHNIPINIIRETALVNDQDLLVDFGIYGSHALGKQIFDEHNRTSQFILQFDFTAVAEADRNWERLLAYSITSQQLLDRPP